MFFGSGGGAEGILGIGRSFGIGFAAGVLMPPGSGLNWSGAFGGLICSGECVPSGFPLLGFGMNACAVSLRSDTATAMSETMERVRIFEGRLGIQSPLIARIASCEQASKAGLAAFRVRLKVGHG